MSSFKSALLAGVLATLALSAAASAAGIDVVAVENVYGDLARQVGGQVRQRDLHPVEPRPGPAPVRGRPFHGPGAPGRQGGDPERRGPRSLDGEAARCRPVGGRTEIVAAALVGKRSGDNPHLWYDPATMKAVAKDLAAKLSAIEPAHEAEFEHNAAAFDASLDPAHQRGAVELVARLGRELGLGVLTSAHDINPPMGAVGRVLYVGRGRAVLGAVDEVLTGPVLSRLYGSPIDVLRVGRRVFVMAGDTEVEREAHRHDGHGRRGPAGHDHAEL